MVRLDEPYSWIELGPKVQNGAPGDEVGQGLASP